MGEGKDTRARGWYEYERESVVREKRRKEGREEKNSSCSPAGLARPEDACVWPSLA